MNIPMSWIYEYTPVSGVDIKEYMDRLTMIGQKVEEVVSVSGELSGIVAGKIVALSEYEGTKLNIAQVDIGNRVITVVTGAGNISVGDIVPVAVEGASTAGGVVIQKTEIKGALSEGMLCSIEDLGFTRQDFPEAPENGIYIFRNSGVEPADDVCELLELRQEVVEYEITSNRPDCFSVTGIAREAAAAFGKPFEMPDLTVLEKAGENASEMLRIEIMEPELCPRYAARIIKNVTVGPSPQWLRRRLTSAGLRPINNIVDITNYVMLEMGQPMHAFDLSCVAGGIVVKRAVDGESFVTLDGVSRQLDSSMLVISDHEKSLAIAGVMGGENSKISLSHDGKAATGAVLLESACFNGANIRQTSKKLGLRTDASSKYEKGLDPNLAESAVNRAAHLVELLGVGEVVKGISDCFPESEKYAEARLPFEADKINALLGTSLSEKDMSELIKPFGIAVEKGVATIPTFRADIEGTADLAEEVARAYGYDRIEPKLLGGAPTVGKRSYEQSIVDVIRLTMVAMGFFEALTYSFEGPAEFDKLRIGATSPFRRAVPIMNPLGESYSLMRTTAASGMLGSLGVNYSKRNKEAFLFELANVYTPKELPVRNLPEQKTVLMGGFYGGEAGFYEAKGFVESLLEVLGIESFDFKVESGVPWLHPGRGASVLAGGGVIGYVGEVHPDCLASFGIGVRAYVFELEVATLCEKAVVIRRFREVPKYPPVQRDIAVTVSEDVAVGDLRGAIVEKGGRLLVAAELFDVYRGGQIGEGLKSVAYSLVFRSRERTLSDGDVNPVMEDIVEELTRRFGARLR